MSTILSPNQKIIGRSGCTIAIAVIVIVAAPTVFGDDKPQAQPPAGGKLVLFDGKGLDGWLKTDFSRPGKIEVEDGTITMGLGTPMTGITSTRKDLPRVDYELTFEAQRTSGSDFFTAATFPVQDSYITFVNGGWGGSVTGLSSLDGMDASENDTSTYFKYENNKWYKFRVWVTNAKVRCWVDDKQVIDATYTGRRVHTRIETHANQPLGFANYDSTSAIRAIVVRPLTADEVAATNK